MVTRLNILLVAGEAAGARVLEMLAATPHRVVAVLIARGPAADAIERTARRHALPTWPASLVRDPGLSGMLTAERVDLLLNVHSLHVIDGDVLAAPRIGAFNLHPGPLPECAGLNAPSWAIALGEREHGVTLHWMAPAIDAGPIAWAERFPIEERDTGLSLSAACAHRGIALVRRLLDTAAEDPRRIPSRPQDPAKRRYHGRAVPYGGRILWSLDARALHDFIRACDYAPFQSPWGAPRATLGGRPLLLLRASRSRRFCSAEAGTVGWISDGRAAVATADEWLLIDRVRVGERGVPASDVVATGMRLGDGV